MDSLSDGHIRWATSTPQRVRCAYLHGSKLAKCVQTKQSRDSAVRSWYQAEWMQAPHCQREIEGKLVLELIRVDLGGPADLIARKCRKDVEARRKLQAFTEMVAEGRFSMVVVTGSTAKAAAIQAALSQHRWPTNLQFRLAVFVSLIPLLPRSL